MKKQTKITRGLVLGKFAPLHKGHQYLIETALKEMNEVIVMIYNCPETIDIPLKTRANWIRNLYPQAKVIEAHDGPKETGHEEWIKKKNEDYVIKKIKQKITHIYSSEWYGEHMSIALNCKNMVVDINRKTYPISGTRVRSNPEKYKDFLHPIVYQDFVKKIVFLGAESSGKTTLTKALSKKYHTTWVPEYGREFWNKNNIDGKLSLEQMVELAKEHQRREEKNLKKANKYLFVDTNAITTEMFSIFYHGKVHKELKKMARENKKRYDVFFVCDIDIPYEDDGTRSGETHRKKFQKQIINDLKRRKIKYMLLTGNLKNRIKLVEQHLKKLNKNQLNIV